MTAIDDERISPTRASHSSTDRLVWDWPVRVFHWSLVIAIVGAFVTNKLGVKYFGLHTFCGYTVIVLVAFRILWGICGARHARFVNFVHGPVAVLRYVSALGRGRRTHYAGHNPLGAIMVLALLALLGAQATFGLFANDEIFNAGPLAGLVSKSVSLGLTSLHRKIFYWIAGAAAIHVAAVMFHVFVKRENLVTAIITGRKAAHLVKQEEAIKSSHGLRAIGLFIALSFAFALLLQFAPAGDSEIAGF